AEAQRHLMLVVLSADSHGRIFPRSMAMGIQDPGAPLLSCLHARRLQQPCRDRGERVRIEEQVPANAAFDLLRRPDLQPQIACLREWTQSPPQRLAKFPSPTLPLRARAAGQRGRPRPVTKQVAHAAFRGQQSGSFRHDRLSLRAENSRNTKDTSNRREKEDPFHSHPTLLHLAASCPSCPSRRKPWR